MHAHTDDPFHLQRFLDAQQSVYERALEELRAGRKRSHWMWFVFPQIAGLGSSAMAERYAISNLDEAHAYLAHPLLGERLLAAARALLGVHGRSAREILGSPDDLKLRSSMTLFAAVPGADPVFAAVLAAYCDGKADPLTLARIRA